MDSSITADQDHPILLQLAIDVWNWSKIPMTEILESSASSYLGQMGLKLADKFLWLIEKSSQWALPPPPTPSNDKTIAVAELTRPLPWILFLPTLLMLRFLREGLSIGALIMGKEPVRPSAIVRFVQNCRRNLRALKYHGMRNMRAKSSTKSPDIKEVNVGFQSWIYWIIIKLQSMMCYSAVKYEHGYQPKAISRKNSGESLVVTKSGNVRSKKSSSLEDEDEDCDTSILRKLVQDLEEFIDSDSDDSDFSLKNEMADDNDTSATSSDEENEGIGYDQPEDEQFSIDKISSIFCNVINEDNKTDETLVNGVKDATNEIVTSSQVAQVIDSNVTLNDIKIASKDEDNSNGLATPQKPKLNPPIIKITPTQEKKEPKVLIIQPENTSVIQINKETEAVKNSQPQQVKSEKEKPSEISKEAKKVEPAVVKTDNSAEGQKTDQIVNGSKEKPVDVKKVQTVEDEKHAISKKTELIEEVKEKSLDVKEQKVEEKKNTVDEKIEKIVEKTKEKPIEVKKDVPVDNKKEIPIEGKKDEPKDTKNVQIITEKKDILDKNNTLDSTKSSEVKPNDNSKSKPNGS